MGLKSIHCLKLLTLFLTLCCCSCGWKGPWREIHSKGPPVWCGVDSPMRIEGREIHERLVKSEWRWVCQGGEMVYPGEVIRSIVSFLEAEEIVVPLLDPENRLEAGRMLKMLGYDLVLVSIEPVVVVMVREDERYVYFHMPLAEFEIPAPGYHQGIEQGSTMPYSLDLYWFTPELGGGIRSPVFLSESLACLNLTEGCMQLTRMEETWVAHRVERCRE